MASSDLFLSVQQVVSDACLSRNDSVNSIDVHKDQTPQAEMDFSPIATSIEKSQFDFRPTVNGSLPPQISAWATPSFQTNMKQSVGTMQTALMSGSKVGSRSGLRPSIFNQQGKKKPDLIVGVPLKAADSRRELCLENPVHLIRRKKTERHPHTELAKIPESDGNTQPADSPDVTDQQASPPKQRTGNIMASGIRFNSRGTMRASEQISTTMLCSRNKYYMLLYARSKSCLELFKSRLLNGISSNIKIYATLTKKRPEYSSLSCICFFELYRGTNRIVTYPWSTLNLYRMAEFVYEDTEVDQLFPLEYLLEQEDLKELSFLWSYFTDKEIAFLMREYLRGTDPVNAFFVKYRKHRDPHKLVTSIFKELRTLAKKRRSILATRQNSPTSSPRYSLKKVAFDPSLGPDPESLKFLVGVDPNTSSRQGSRFDFATCERTSVMFDSLLCEPNLVYMTDGYNSWSKGMFKLLQSQQIQKPSDEKFKKLVQKIRGHLEEDRNQPSKLLSQVVVNTASLQYISDRLPGSSPEELEALASAHPTPNWLIRFESSGDLDILLVELKTAAKHAVSASMGKFNSSHQELRLRLSRLEASPSQALSQSGRRRDLEAAKRRASLNRFVTNSGLVRQQRAKRTGVHPQMPFVLPRAPEEGMSDIGENLSASQQTPTSEDDSFFYGKQPDLEEVCEEINQRFRLILEKQMASLKKHLHAKLNSQEKDCLEHLLQEDNIFLLEQLLKMDHQPDDSCVNMSVVEAHIRPFLAAKVKEQEDLITVDKEDSEFNRSRAFIMADLKIYFDQDRLAFADYDALVKQAVDADDNVLGIYECFSVRYTHQNRSEVRHDTVESLDMLAKVLNGKQKGREIRKRLVSEQLKVGILGLGNKKPELGDLVHPDSCPTKQRETWPNTFNKVLEKSRAQKILAEISPGIGQVVTDIFEKVGFCLQQELSRPEDSFSQDLLLLFEIVNEQYPNLRKQFLEFMKGSIFVPPSFGLRQLVNIYKSSALAKDKSFGDLMQVWFVLTDRLW